MYLADSQDRRLHFDIVLMSLVPVNSIILFMKIMNLEVDPIRFRVFDHATTDLKLFILAR
jgi:hypothetical protein